MDKFLVILALVVILAGFASGVHFEDEILDAFDGSNKIKVSVEKSNSEILSISNDLGVEEVSRREGEVSILVSKEELESLVENKKISKFEIERVFSTAMQDAVGIIEANLTWGLESSGINLNGSGKSICILDTGINNSHPDFEGRILAEKCFCSASDNGAGGCCPDLSEEDDSATDDEGHGTHVAGIAGASGGINGVAKGAGLVIVKIMNSTGSGIDSDLRLGIDWCIENADTYNISVITASIGTSNKYTSACDGAYPMTTAKINEAVAEGISVTIASGNDDWNDGINWPACISSATPVGGVDKSDNLEFNRNSLVKLLGIGVGVNSTWIYGGYRAFPGTSMATPMVAGAIAIISEYLTLTDRSMTTEEIEDILYYTGEPISELGNNYSRINIYNAILSLDVDPPSVSLTSPVDNYFGLIDNHTFTCNTSDWQLSNLTLKVWNSTGIYYENSTSISGTTNETSFNLTNMPKDEYIWNCFSSDEIGNLGIASSNSSLTVGNVAVSLNSPADESFTNINESHFNCTSKSNPSYELENVTFYLWNSSNLVWNESKNISGFENESIFEYNFTLEEEYRWSCSSYNNNSDMASSGNFSLTYDYSPPVISALSSESIGSSSATISWNTNESSNSSLSLNSGSWSNSSIYELNHSIAISSLSSSTSYSYTAISCDEAGNCANESGSFTTAAAPVSSSGGGSSPSSGGGSTYKTINLNNEEFILGKNNSLSAGDKINFNLTSGSHKLEVKRVGLNYVELLIESDPINVNISTGEERVFNLSSKDYYDLLVKIEFIENGKADIFIKRISKKINQPNNDNDLAEEGEVIFHITNEEKTSFPIIFQLILVWTLAFAAWIFFIFHHKKRIKRKRFYKKYGKGKKTKIKAKR